MLVGKHLVALVALISGFTAVSALPGNKDGCGCGNGDGSKKGSRDIESAFSGLVPDSTRCFSRYGNVPRATSDVQTRWKTRTSCSTTTCTYLSSTTVTPATWTSTLTTTATTTETDSTVTKAATETSTVTDTTTATTTTDTTTTSISTSTISKLFIPTSNGFVPVQSSYPGAIYNDETANVPREHLNKNQVKQLAKVLSNVGGALVRGLSRAHRESYLEDIFCEKYETGRSTTVYTTSTTTYTAATPSTTITTTVTSTVSTTPLASTTTTVLTTTTSTATVTDTNTDTTTVSTTVAAATITNVYQACQTDNFANTDANGNDFTDGHGNYDNLHQTPVTSAEECCALAFSGTRYYLGWAFDANSKNCFLPYFDSADERPSQGAGTFYASDDGDLQLTVGNANCGKYQGFHKD